VSAACDLNFIVTG